MISLTKDLKPMYGANVKYAKCYNAGENKDSERACKQEWMSIQFEYTMSGTPQQNDRVEREFATLLNRVLLCWPVGNFLFSWEMSYRQSSQHCHYISRDLSSFQQFLVRKREES